MFWLLCCIMHPAVVLGDKIMVFFMISEAGLQAKLTTSLVSPSAIPPKR